MLMTASLLRKRRERNEKNYAEVYMIIWNRTRLFKSYIEICQLNCPKPHKMRYICFALNFYDSAITSISTNTSNSVIKNIEIKSSDKKHYHSRQNQIWFL